MSFHFESARLSTSWVSRGGGEGGGGGTVTATQIKNNNHENKRRRSPAGNSGCSTHFRGIYSVTRDVGVTLRSAVSWSGLPE